MKPPSALPTGTVTFLFTDMEGSTRLIEAYPEPYRVALARHDTVLGEAIATNGGIAFQRTGDGFAAAFVSPTAAVRAALQAQAGLQQEAWGEVGPIKVRMGLHSGEVDIQDGQYFGLALHRCARLMGVAHGGQVLLSEATAALARETLPPRTWLEDLGGHALRDLQHAERIFQLRSEQLLISFPPLRTPTVLPNNLPRQLSSFVGRERAIAEVKGLLETTSLLTLIGSAGAGKTRLALQVAAGLLNDFADGVWLVELAALSDPTLVAQRVATALQVHEEPRRPIIETLTRFLGSKSMLLILDNCEHLIDACAMLAETLLRSSARLRILATSREALNISGEHTWRVPSLSLPGPHTSGRTVDVTQFEAVRLFIERSVAAAPGFSVRPEQEPAIVQVCQRLDGIPLAIELAAARVKFLSPEQIATRLDDRFQLLTGGSRTALPRQRTLRALVDWSYDLLIEQEKMLLGRLSVFAGGCTFEAIDAICSFVQVDSEHDRGKRVQTAVAPINVLDVLAQLVNKSLVLVEEESKPVRYRLLETIRQYAGEKLLEAGESEQVRDRHLGWFLDLALHAETALKGPRQGQCLLQLELELDNLRSALEWSRGEPGAIPKRISASTSTASTTTSGTSTSGTSTTKIEDGLRLASALDFFWVVRARLREGREHLVGLLALTSTHNVVRAKALAAAGWLAYLQGDHDEATSMLGESLKIARELSDASCVARALQLLGLVAYARRDYARARALFEESLHLAQKLGEQVRVYGVLENLADLAWAQRDFDQVGTLHEQALILKRHHGDKHGIAYSLRGLGDLARSQNAYDQAVAFYLESLDLVWALRDRLCVCRSLDGLALVACAQRRAEQAARLLGIAEATRDAVGFVLSPDRRADYEAGMSTTRSMLGEDTFLALWTDGNALPFDAAVDVARRLLESD